MAAIKKAPDYSDRPTVIVGYDPNDIGAMNVSLVGFPEDVAVLARIVLRDWSRGDTPDEDGDFYEDEEVGP